MIFYLGTHKPEWLAMAGFPLFVSHRRLAGRKSMPRAAARWALDSGGFSELKLFGEWRTKPSDYAQSVVRYTDEIGHLDWAAIQDWMCEPFMLERTGKTIEEHQQRTIESLLTLRALAPGVRWIPVLQGWELADYLRHAEMYARGGVDLGDEAIVGIGSVCRRQATTDAETIIRQLAVRGLKLHGFGFKVKGLARVGEALVSADSLAWSFQARYRPPIEGHTHKNCANCFTWAVRWRQNLLRGLAVP